MVTIKVPFAVRERGGRKPVLGRTACWRPQYRPTSTARLIKAIARAFRWQKMLETSKFTTIREIAKAERINPSYVSRVLRLTLLALRR
jgi:hypothetical protein